MFTLMPRRQMTWTAKLLVGFILATVALFVWTFSNGCVTEVVQPEDVVDPGDLAGIAEQYCKSHPDLPCGKVYAFPNTPADNKLGFVELCIPQPGLQPDGTPRPTLEEAEAVYGPSELSPDPRFASGNLCWFCCGPGCTRGCNAYNSCWCPENPTP